MSGKTALIKGRINTPSTSRWDYEDLNRIIERLMNEISKKPTEYEGIEYMFRLIKDQESGWFTYVSSGTERWTKLAKNPLGGKSREDQRLLFYNIDTKFWMIIHNHNTPDVFKKFLKDNRDMFTHIISLYNMSLDDRTLSGLVGRLERNEMIKEIKDTVSELKVLVGVTTVDNALNS